MDIKKLDAIKIRNMYLILSGLLMLLALITAVLRQFVLTFVVVVLASLVMIIGSQIALRASQIQRLKKIK